MLIITFSKVFQVARDIVSECWSGTPPKMAFPYVLSKHISLLLWEMHSQSEASIWLASTSVETGTDASQ